MQKNMINLFRSHFQSTKNKSKFSHTFCLFLLFDSLNIDLKMLNKTMNHPINEYIFEYFINIEILLSNFSIFSRLLRDDGFYV